MASYAVAECKEVELYCAAPKETRKINGVDVLRDCWQYKYKLNCEAKSKNNCNSISTDQCVFLGEECAFRTKEADLDFCANWLRRFSCKKNVKYTKEHINLKGNEGKDSKELLCNSMCLDGTCPAIKKADTESNDELAQSVGILDSVADIRKGRQGDHIINIFKGYSRECSDHPLNFMNCCKISPNGWGEAIKLGHCSADELNIAKLRDAEQCIEVGTYCETEILGVCIDERNAFCCFDSVIARILNQEAKKQLGRGYGIPENPDCSGIDLNDLAKVDFTKADFSAFHRNVISRNISPPNVKADADFMEERSKKGLSKDNKAYNQQVLRE